MLLDSLNKTKNITHSSELLFTTQSALSKRIIALEEELGVKLMTRSRSGIHFTPEGEIVLEYARRANEELSRMRAELEASRKYISGTINAGISINYARYILPDILALFRKKYSHVTVHITTNQSRHIYMKLLNGEIDVAIVRGSYDWKESSVLLSSESICAISEHEDDLSELPYIARKTDAIFEREILQWMRERNVNPKMNFEVDNIETCTEMAKRGLGWAIVPEICLKDFDGSIRKLYFADGRAFTRQTFMLYPDDAVKLRQVKAFINTVKKFHSQEEI